jgi:hypothetical protein
MARKTTRKSTAATKATRTRKATSTKKATRKSTATKKTTRKAAKRELIDTGSDKRYVRRGGAGRFKESDDVGQASASDRRKKAQTKAKRGQGDKGDR